VERFGRWHESWKRDNVTAEMENTFGDWMHGRVGGLKPGLVTVPKLTDGRTRAPYHRYTKYSVVNEVLTSQADD